MPENRDFSHLPLPFLYRGKPKLRGFNSPEFHAPTLQNKLSGYTQTNRNYQSLNT